MQAVEIKIFTQVNGNEIERLMGNRWWKWTPKQASCNIEIIEILAFYNF